MLTSDSGKKMLLILNKAPTVCGFIKEAKQSGEIHCQKSESEIRSDCYEGTVTNHGWFC